MNITATTRLRLRPALGAVAAGLCALAGPSPHGGEGLYAVAGVPLSLDDTPVVLYRVEGGGLAKVRTVATLRQNPHVVKSYPEKGFVFVVSDGAFKGSFLVDILDLGDMSRERSVDFDMCDGCIFSKARLLERNGHLVFYIRAGGDGPEGEHVSYYLGVDLHGGDFVRDIGRADVTYLHHAGGQSGGVDGSDYMGGIYVRERNPDQPYVLRHSDTFDLRWQLPDWFSKPEGAHMQQVANNDHARVVSVGGGPEGTSQWLVFDKSAGRWSGVPTSTYPFGGDDRLVGRWLVQEEIRDGFDGAAWDESRERPGPERCVAALGTRRHDRPRLGPLKAGWPGRGCWTLRTRSRHPPCGGRTPRNSRRRASGRLAARRRTADGRPRPRPYGRVRRGLARHRADSPSRAQR